MKFDRGSASYRAAGTVARQRDIHVAVGEQAAEPRRDRRLARDRPGLDPAVGVDRRPGPTRSTRTRPVRHVLGRAVGEMGRDAQRERFARASASARSARRRSVPARARRPACGASRRRSSGAPSRTPRPPAPAAGRRRAAAAPWPCAAAGSRSGISRETRRPPASLTIASWSKPGSKPSSDKAKPVLAPRLAVTGPGIAAGPRQDRLDIPLERHRPGLRRPRHPKDRPGPGRLSRSRARKLCVPSRSLAHRATVPTHTHGSNLKPSREKDPTILQLRDGHSAILLKFRQVTAELLAMSRRFVKIRHHFTWNGMRSDEDHLRLRGSVNRPIPWYRDSNHNGYDLPISSVTDSSSRSRFAIQTIPRCLATPAAVSNCSDLATLELAAILRHRSLGGAGAYRSRTSRRSERRPGAWKSHLPRITWKTNRRDDPSELTRHSSLRNRSGYRLIRKKPLRIDAENPFGCPGEVLDRGCGWRNREECHV